MGAFEVTDAVQADITRTAVQAIRATGGAHSRLDAALREAGRTDSPIEAIFAAVFTIARDHLVTEGLDRFLLALRPQFEIEPYRLDFAVEPMDRWLCEALAAAKLQLRVGVELDGHDFHERTAAQVTARDRRDRYLSGLGWRVLHFSGAELHRNPMQPVVEVLVAGADALDAAKSELLLRR